MHVARQVVCPLGSMVAHRDRFPGNSEGSGPFFGEGETSSYRSMLYFSEDGDEVLSGPLALSEFVANAGSGRLIQSFKSSYA